MPTDTFGRGPGNGTQERPFPSLRPLPVRAALLVALLLASACGGARLQHNVISADLGHGSRYELDEAVNDILHRAGYSVQRRTETSGRIYYETGWQTRQPYQEEQARGAEECRTRIIVEAHRQRLNVYSVRLRAENRARTRFEDEWGPAPTSRAFREHVDELSTAIHMQIDAGVRVY